METPAKLLNGHYWRVHYPVEWLEEQQKHHEKHTNAAQAKEGETPRAEHTMNQQWNQLQEVEVEEEPFSFLMLREQVEEKQAIEDPNQRAWRKIYEELAVPTPPMDHPVWKCSP